MAEDQFITELRDYADNNFISVDEEGWIAFCTLCEVNLTLNLQNFITHANGQPHQREVEAYEFTRLNNFAQRNFIILVPSARKAYCPLCDVHLTRNIRNFQTHVKGNCHRTELTDPSIAALTNYGRVNDITVYEDEWNAHCDLCDVNLSVSLVNFQKHIVGTNHQRQLEDSDSESSDQDEESYMSSSSSD